MIDNTNTNNNQVPQTSYTEAGQYFSNGEFFNDIAAQNNSRILKTGFANLDNIQQLGPGLYVSALSKDVLKFLANQYLGASFYIINISKA